MAETQVHSATADASPARNSFLDENGNPSDRCGPDLTKAEPIDQVVKRLSRLRNDFAVDFWKACRDSAIDVSVMRSAEGVDRLMLGMPCDIQEDIRWPRHNALVEIIRRSDRRRHDVIELANLLGHFADNQPFGSSEEAANAFLAAGGSIWVDTDGQCDWVLPKDEDALAREPFDEYPLRRLLQRFEATMRRNGDRAALATFVRECSSLHDSLGRIVLEAKDVADVE